MQDRLLIVTKTKKSIEYVERIIINFPRGEIVLKNKLISSYYDLLELIYKANIYKEINCMKDVLVKIRMIEYYIKVSFDKKLISLKKYEIIGNHLLELNRMVNSWVMYEKNK